MSSIIARYTTALFVGLATAGPLLADDAAAATGGNMLNWPPHTFQGAVACTAIFGLLGIVLALVGFKLFDWLTPGDLQKEVIENKNMAAAIVAAAVIIGICHILAAAVH